MLGPDIIAIIEVTEEQQDYLVDECATCWYCHELLKKCDTLIPGAGVIVGEIDVVKYRNRFWHRGCILDWDSA